MRRPIATPGALAAMLALAFAGCGGKSAATTTTGPAASPATTEPTLTAATTTAAPTATATTPPAAGTSPAGTPPASGGPPLTKSAFIGQADVICREAQVEFAAQQKQIDAAGIADQAHDTLPNRVAVANALRSDLTLAEQQLARLRGLTPPAADRPTVNAYFAAVANQLNLVSRLASGIAANDATGVKRLNTELSNGVAQARTLAAAYGFRVCGAGTA